MNNKEYIKPDKWLGGESHPNPDKLFDILSQDRYKPALKAIARQIQENPQARELLSKGIQEITQLPEVDALAKKVAADHAERTDNERDIGPMTVALAVGIVAFILFVVKRSHDRYDK